MAIKHTGKFNAICVADDSTKTFNSLHEAKDYVEGIVGNSSFKKMFPNEETYIYGPGDGTTSYMIRAEIIWEK